MTKKIALTGASVRRFAWLPAVLLLVVLVAAFGPSIGGRVINQLTSKPPVSFVAPPNRPTPYEVIDALFDTPPLVPASIGSAAAHALADKIDASIAPGFGGLKLYCSYISGHSYQNSCGFVLDIPAVQAYPAAPAAPVLGTDSYKNALAKHAYDKAFATWQKTITHMQQQLPAIQHAVHLLTNKLRALTFPYNNQASDLYGGLADASAHFKNVPGSVVKQLVIVSDLVNNTPAQNLGSLSLSGVSVTVTFFTCSDSASTCQARTSSLATIVHRAGSKNFQVFDVAQSNPFPVPV